MDDKKIEQIYDMIIDGIQLTEISLTNYGFTKEEITMLLKDNTLKEIEEEYTLSSIVKLYRYGIKLLLIGNAKRANKCFGKCHEIEPNNRDVCLQLLYYYMRLGNYPQTFKMLSYIETITPKEKHIDNNLYLYMLNKLTDCPEQYQERITKMTVEDILIPNDNENSSTNKLNDIRMAIMKNKYKYALNLLNNILATEITYNIELSLLKEILLHLIYMEDKLKLKIIHIAKTKKYGLIILFLKARSEKRNLNITEKCIWLISEDILDITRTKTIPPQTVTYTDSVYEAIEGRNYQLARKLNRNFLKAHRLQPEDDILDMLLTDINELISRIKEGKEASILKISPNELTDELEQNEKYAQDLAYYINSERLSLDEATKICKLNQEQVLLVKLIYARDCYTEEMYQQGDLLIQEVETTENISTRVVSLLNEIKANRMLYANKIRPYTRKRTILKYN